MNIAAKLNAKGATQETILQIMATTAFEVSGELSSAEMETELLRQYGDTLIADAEARLKAQPTLVSEVALRWITELANDPQRAGLLEGAISDADGQMPMLEVGALTLIALYCLYLMSPPRPKKIRNTVRHSADGTYEVTEDLEIEGFDAPLRGLLGLFAKNDKTN